MKRTLLAAVATAAVLPAALLAAPAHAIPMPDSEAYASGYIYSSSCTLTDGSNNLSGDKAIKANKTTTFVASDSPSFVGSDPSDVIDVKRRVSSTTRMVVKQKSFKSLSFTGKSTSAVDPALGKGNTSCSGFSSDASASALIGFRVKGKGTLKFRMKAVGTAHSYGLLYAINLSSEKVYATQATSGAAATLTVPVSGSGGWVVQTGTQTSASASGPLTASVELTVNGSFEKGRK